MDPQDTVTVLKKITIVYGRQTKGTSNDKQWDLNVQRTLRTHRRKCSSSYAFGGSNRGATQKSRHLDWVLTPLREVKSDEIRGHSTQSSTQLYFTGYLAAR